MIGEVVWSGALERDAIRAQQRQPEIVPVIPHVERRIPRMTVQQFLARHPGWWTCLQIGLLVGIPEQTVGQAVKVLAEQGYVRRFRAARGCKGTPQKYQWMGHASQAS